MITVLAFDTATERASIALAARGRVWAQDAAGGAQASTTLIPAIMALLDEAAVSLHELDAIAFGRGPGAFTGLRTACSVAQGLAFGAGKPVLPVDTLLAVAEDARERTCGGEPALRVWVANDARMNEIYAAHYAFDAGRWTTLAAPFVTNATLLSERWSDEPPQLVAGSALALFADTLRSGAARRVPDAVPRAQALLPLAQALWNEGGALDAALAIPLYVRDKVAQTMAERDAQRQIRDAAQP
jgi:tRNA threonylcarbamoyladenosine biosynthesis protein TsaB